MPKETRLITAALPYTNNIPHLGNIVGSHLPADIFARFSRLMSHDTLFVGGTDEHGTTSEIAAIKCGISPKELCDFFYKAHKEIYDWFQISYNNFSRTSRQIHHTTTIEFMNQVKRNGYIKEGKIKVPYCKICNRELADRYIKGKCPNCSYENARGDQCESCTSILNPTELIDPRCEICNSLSIEFKDSNHLFLDLTKLSGKLEAWIKENKIWRKQVSSLAMGWISKGLKERCITRNLKWGVKVPYKNYNHLVFYVWVDAPIGYISATKEISKKWKNYWQKKSKIYHFIGKDNIPFHTIFWPALLIANGKYNLPYNVVGLQYLNYETGKFSKSTGRGIFCENLKDAGLAPDYWRFYLSFLIPETKDTEFKWNEFQEKINKELIGNIGNFIHRTLSFITANYNGKIPSPISIKPKQINQPYKKPNQHKKFLDLIKKKANETILLLDKIELRQALEKILEISAAANKYFQDNEPWKNKEESSITIYNCVNICYLIASLLLPYIPSTSKKIFEMLNTSQITTLTPLSAKNPKIIKLKPNHKINKVSPLFEKLEADKIEKLKQIVTKPSIPLEVAKIEAAKINATDKEKNKISIQKEMHKEIQAEKIQKEKVQKNKMSSATQNKTATANRIQDKHIAEEKDREAIKPITNKDNGSYISDYIPFNTWKKMNLKIGKIIKAEKHPNADKLYILLISLGPGENKRQVIAGLASAYKLEELIGKKVVLFVNLEPAIIRGVESNGMLLAAVYKDKISIIQPDSDIIEGAKVE